MTVSQKLIVVLVVFFAILCSACTGHEDNLSNTDNIYTLPSTEETFDMGSSSIATISVDTQPEIDTTEKKEWTESIPTELVEPLPTELTETTPAVTEDPGYADTSFNTEPTKGKEINQTTPSQGGTSGQETGEDEF